MVKKPRPPVVFRPEGVDIALERMLAMVEQRKLIPVLITVSQHRCDQILRNTGKSEVQTLQGVELRVNRFMPDDMMGVRYADGQWEYWEL